MNVLRVLLCAVLGSVLFVGAASARSADDDDGCRKVNAVGVGQDLGEGNTTAIIRRAGFLNGTTAAHFDISGAPPVFTFAGSIVFTARKGTLTVAITGTFDVSNGAFTGSGPVTGGTGRFAGATGTLTFAGVEDFSTGMFTETIKGQVCLDEDDDDD